MSELTLIRFNNRKRRKKRHLNIHKLRLETAKTPKQLRNKLTEVFNRYIRERDGKCMMGEMWSGCRGGIDAGHVIPISRSRAVRYDEENVFGQCRYHNLVHVYNDRKYEAWYVQTYGADKFTELVKRSRAPFKNYTVQELKDLIAKYETKLNEL